MIESAESNVLFENEFVLEESLDSFPSQRSEKFVGFPDDGVKDGRRLIRHRAAIVVVIVIIVVVKIVIIVDVIDVIIVEFEIIVEIQLRRLVTRR